MTFVRKMRISTVTSIYFIFRILECTLFIIETSQWPYIKPNRPLESRALPPVATRSKA